MGVAGGAGGAAGAGWGELECASLSERAAGGRWRRCRHSTTSATASNTRESAGHGEGSPLETADCASGPARRPDRTMADQAPAIAACKGPHNPRIPSRNAASARAPAHRSRPAQEPQPPAPPPSSSMASTLRVRKCHRGGAQPAWVAAPLRGAAVCRSAPPPAAADPRAHAAPPSCQCRPSCRPPAAPPRRAAARSAWWPPPRSRRARRAAPRCSRPPASPPRCCCPGAGARQRLRLPCLNQ